MTAFRFENKNDRKLLDVLVAFQELWPEEIRVLDLIEVECSSRRACAAIGALVGKEETDLKNSEPARPHREIAKIKGNGHPKSLEKVCLEYGQPFTAIRSRARYCSNSCMHRASNRRYRANKNNQDKSAESAEPTADESDQAAYMDGKLWLDVRTGELLDIYALNTGLHNGVYGPGYRFRRSDGRMYVVETRTKPSGMVQYRLKQVYDKEAFEAGG